MKFILSFIFSSLSLAILLVLFILGVDPYDKLGNNFFNFEHKAVAQSRENKFLLLKHAKSPYDAFILGSSSAHRYSTKTAYELTKLKTFNYAVQHTTTIDYLVILKHIIETNKPKLIFLQLGLTDIDGSYKIDNRLYSSSLNKYIHKQSLNNTTATPKPIFDYDYFTLKALSDSFRVVHVNLFGKANHIYLEHGDYINEAPPKGKIKIKQQEIKDEFFISKKRVEYLKEFKRLSDENNIKLIVFSAPISLDHFNKIKTQFPKELEKVYSLYKDIFPGFQNINDIEFLSRHNTSEYFMNSNHPSKKMSDIILKIVINKSIENERF